MSGGVTRPLHGILDVVVNRRLAPTLIGRRDELEFLLSRLDQAREGTTQVVLLGGEAGVGKTRLIEELLVRADGIQTLVGGCVDLGDDALPFAPFSAALREPMRRAGVDGLVSLAAGGAHDRRRLYEAVTDLLEEMTDEVPVILVLEDLHWADRSTRELLAFLSRSLHGAALLIIASYRTDEIHRSHPLRPFVAELSRSVDRLELDRLDLDDVTELLTQLLERPPARHEVARLFDSSEGNPFLLEELAACGVGPGLPPSIRELLLVRVERLAPTAQQVLHTAAVIGVEIPHPLLTAVCARQHLSDVEVMQALRDAVDAYLLVPSGDDGYRFRHSLLRESLHQDLLPGEHTQLHATLARTLTAHPDLVDPERLDAEVAHHWYSAHDLPRALPAALTAAQSARELHAYAEQLRLLERALGLWPVVPDAEQLTGTTEIAVAMDATVAAGRDGESARALAFAERAVQLAERGGDHEQLARCLARRAKWRVHSDPSQALVDVRQALSALPTGAQETRVRIMDALASILMLHGDHAEATATAWATVELAKRLGDRRTELSSSITLGTLLVDAGEVDEGLSIARRALSRAEADDEQLMVARALTNLSHELTGLGRHREAVDAARRGLEVVNRIGLARTFATVLGGNEADSLVALGALDQAGVAIADSLSVGSYDSDGSIYLEQLRGLIALYRGDLEGASRSLHLALADRGPETLLPQDGLPLQRLRALISLNRGNPEDSYREAIGPVLNEHAMGHTRYYWPLLCVAADAACLRARTARDRDDGPAQAAAAADLSDVERLAGQIPVAGGTGDAWRSHVAASLATARGAATVETWVEVASAYAKVEEPYPQGDALLRAAEIAAAEGERSRAKALIREADALATGIGPGLLRDGVDSLARRVRVELAPTTAEGSAEPKPAGPAAAFGLTDRELEVLRRVAEGSTNRQIAEQLYISPKTVSVHVSNILAKFGVASRGEAAAMAHRNDLA